MGNGAATLRDVELAGPEAGAATQGELVAYVARALRAPSASIKAYTEILLDDAEPESQRAAFLATINQEADYLTGLIDSLLNVARIESGRLRLHAADVDLPALLAAVQPAFAPPLAARELAWAVTIAEGVPALRGDPDLLTILLRNLLANAVAHNRRGGRVIVELAPAPGGGVRLTVGDEGGGAAALPDRARLRGAARRRRPGGPAPLLRLAAATGHPGRDAAQARRLGRLRPAARAVRRADHHAQRARAGGRSGARAAGRRR